MGPSLTVYLWTLAQPSFLPCSVTAGNFHNAVISEQPRSKSNKAVVMWLICVIWLVLEGRCTHQRFYTTQARWVTCTP